MQPPQDGARSGSFVSTPWAWVLAMRPERELTDTEKDLASRCLVFRRPILSFIESQGYGEYAARELALRFMVSLIDLNNRQGAGERGPFARRDVLARLKRFLAEEQLAERG